jgi:hypothetical protein
MKFSVAILLATAFGAMALRPNFSPATEEEKRSLNLRDDA